MFLIISASKYFRHHVVPKLDGKNLLLDDVSKNMIELMSNAKIVINIAAVIFVLA